MRFLIAGSSGFLGTRLRAHLLAQGHLVTPLVRRPPEAGEARWDPASGTLDAAIVDEHDVVVNLAGSSLIGNPHSKKWAREQLASRVSTTRLLAEAIADSRTKPSFLAGNGISFYGDYGSEPVTENAASRGDALLTSITKEWQRATEPASEAGARVCVLRTAPVYDKHGGPMQFLLPLFRVGLGGRLGDGTQYSPMISTRDWVAAVTHLANDPSLSGPVNLCCATTPTNAEFTQELGGLLGRPTLARMPAMILRRAAGPMAPELLRSTRAVPGVLLESGFDFADAEVGAVLREAISPTR